jgi:uncharacterized membrane protein YgdD (TMEM256/DUF423 family)
MERLWVGFGAIAGMTMVGMAAYAAHGLQGVAPSVLTGVNSAIEMQGIHALALVFTGLWARRAGVLAHLAGVAFLAGIVMFCGTIYQPIAPAWLRGLHVPMLAPAGGMSLIAGWAFLWLSALRR